MNKEGIMKVVVVVLCLIPFIQLFSLYNDWAKEEEQDRTALELAVEDTLKSNEYVYFVDGIQLDTIDSETIENLHKYNVVIDDESKKVVLTTRVVQNHRTRTLLMPLR